MATTTTRRGRKRLREKKLPAHEVTTSTIATTMFIPRDIIVEIFSWLPMKSLLRFRRGCKYLSDIISHPDSIKLHLQRCCSTRRIIQLQSPSLLIHRSNGLGRKLSQCYLKSYNGRSSCSLSSQVRISHPLESVAEGFVSLGSCNGLLLYTSDDHNKLCIWNPFTQEYKMLPDPPPLTKVSVVETKGSTYGFGYDHTINDYKVIRNTFTSSVQVYTLGTNSWRSIGRNPYVLRHCFYEHRSGKFVNGFLYWMDNFGKKIISFDVAKEKFQEITTEQLPECFLGKMHTMDLQVFEGSLCLVQNINDHDNYYNAYQVQMWVMKDNGANEYNSTSWTRLFAKPIWMYARNGYDKRVKPLIRFSENGDILLLKHGIDLVLFDPKSNSIRTVVTNRICKDGEVKEVYTKSLVSLNSGTYVQGYKKIKCNIKCKA